ncbi:MAG: cytochrome C oxidase subunit IV family protein [Nitrococcus sp.]|nr:cytochrome C oxidase subunit IV family protein [Nitrococcus sp.]
MTIRALTATWLTLLGLTLAMWFLRDYRGSDWLAFVVLIVVAIKGQLVIDRFMELRHAPILWRITLSGWLLTVLGVIGVMRVTTVP